MLARLLLLALLIPPAAAQTTYAWEGANPGDWATAANWEPEGVPGPGDAVVISSGQPVLDEDATVANATLAGGMLSGDGNLTVTGTFTWAGGTLNGRDYSVNSALTIPAGAALLIVGEANKTLRGRDIFNDGVIVWEGAGDVIVNWGTRLENRSGATFDVRTDAALTRTNGSLDLINDGLLVKTAGAGTTTFNYPFGQFANHGTVRVDVGTLLLSNGTSSFAAAGDGTFVIQGGARLRFNQAAYNFGAGSTVTGPGTLFVTGGTARIGRGAVTGPTIIEGGTLAFMSTDTPTELVDVGISGGRLGGAGVVNVTGLLSWSGGYLGGSGGVFNLMGGVSVGGDVAKYFGGGTLNNSGTLSWAGTGNIVVTAGTTFNNLQGADFDIQNDAVMTRTNGSFRFVNSGVVRKSGGSGTTTIETPFGPFNNDGEVSVETGTLYVRVSGTGSNSVDSGAWIAEDGALLRFNLHQRTFTETASIRGTGTVDFAGGTFVNRGTVAPGLSTGILNVAGNYPLPQATGVLEIELGGLEPGTGHDRLAVVGTANLRGVLRLALADGYIPAVGEEYVVVTAATVTGTFSAVEPPDGVTVDVAYDTSSVAVTVTSVTVASEPQSGLPAITALHAPAPNPVRGRATLRYDIAEAGRVRLTVYDMLGRAVAEVVDGDQPRGRHAAVLEAGALPAGTYVVRMHATGVAALSRTLTVIR